MTGTELITLNAYQSFFPPICIRVISAGGSEGDSDLTLVIDSDPLLGGPASRAQPIPPSEAQAIWQLLDAVEICDAQGSAIGLDGTSFGLTIERPEGRASYEWWGSPESEWDEVGRLVGELIDLAGADGARLRQR